MSAARVILRLLERLADLAALAGGVTVLLLALLIGVDVVARKLLGVSVQGTDELGGYVLAMVGSLGMAHVLARREFTRIDLLFRYLARPVRNLLHALAYVTLAGLAVFMARHALITLDDTLLFQSRANTPLRTPLWIPQGLWAGGMCFFALLAVIHAVRATVLMFAAPNRMAGEYGLARSEEAVAEYRGDSAR
ncbi:MAG: TRAP transporter small permease [Rhodobacteraceae bacterium]|nr:TRAP transporter small permease [Paracoccaceae bacterium]